MARKAKPDGGAALYRLIGEITQTHFRLREAGKREGAVTTSGGGLWGLLRSLAEGGPATVPTLARQRPVARQHIQKLADEAAAQGLVAFVDNPDHKRSKLVTLTPKGARAFAKIDDKVRRRAAALAAGFAVDELETTAAILRRLRQALGSRD